LQKWQDIELIYAGQRMQDNAATLATYHVPPGVKQHMQPGAKFTDKWLRRLATIDKSSCSDA